MKRYASKVLAIFFMAVLAISGIMLTPSIDVHAATPSFNKTKMTVVAGRTGTITVQDEENVKSQVWSSSKKDVCTVNSKGVVTAVAAGKATIKCKLTMSDNSVKTLSCTVTVKQRVPATSVTITGTTISELNAQIMYVGDTITIGRDREPSNTTDYAYYFVNNTKYASVSTSGVIKAKKPGVVMVEARMGINQKDAARADNMATDYFLLLIYPKQEITPTPTLTPTPTPTITPTPTPIPVVKPQVSSVILNSSRELEIRFNTPIDETSVINGTDRLISGTVIVAGTDGASKTGTLIPSFSEDKTKLYLTTTEKFDGTYIITVSENVKAISGEHISAYTKQIELKDKKGPSYVGTTLDEEGFVNYISFNEAIDISGMQVVGVNGSTNEAVKILLQDKENYRLSEDKKSISIDLRSSGVTKLGAAVQITGIKDMAGNLADPWIASVTIYTDAGEKPLANLLGVERVSKTLIKANFDRSIVYAGTLTLSNVPIQGIIDEKDKKVVYYTLPDNLKNLTGNQIVTLTGWHSINSNTFKSTNETRYINFTLDTQAPVIVNSEISTIMTDGKSSAVLTLTFNEDIVLSTTKGNLQTKINGSNGTILNKTLSYTAAAKGNKVLLTFTDGQALESGTYTFYIPSGIVQDKFENLSIAQSIAVARAGDSSSSLPSPRKIEQDSKDPSIIYLYFDNKLDLSTVSMVSNYKFGNAYPISAECIAQTDTSAQVKLTFASGAFPFATSYPFVINGIRGYAGSYGIMKEYTGQIGMVENVKPTIKSAKMTSTSTIQVEFSENVTGTCEVIVYVNGLPVSCQANIFDGILYISLVNITTSKNIYFVVTSNEIYDNFHNKADIPLNTPRYVTTIY